MEAVTAGKITKRRMASSQEAFQYLPLKEQLQIQSNKRRRKTEKKLPPPLIKIEKGQSPDLPLPKSLLSPITPVRKQRLPPINSVQKQCSLINSSNRISAGSNPIKYVVPQKYKLSLKNPLPVPEKYTVIGKVCYPSRKFDSLVAKALADIEQEQRWKEMKH
eukprot:TCONS_00048951-protein